MFRWVPAAARQRIFSPPCRPAVLPVSPLNQVLADVPGPFFRVRPDLTLASAYFVLTAGTVESASSAAHARIFLALGSLGDPPLNDFNRETRTVSRTPF